MWWFHLQINNYVCMQLCRYVGMSVCRYAGMHVCMYACMHACMHVCMYVCIYVFMYLCIYVCIGRQGSNLGTLSKQQEFPCRNYQYVWIPEMCAPQWATVSAILHGWIYMGLYSPTRWKLLFLIFWLYYNNSLTWIKAIWDDFPKISHDFQRGRRELAMRSL